MGIDFGIPYTFTIIVQDPAIPRKSNYTKSFQITFAQPTTPTNACPSTVFKQSGTAINSFYYNTLNATDTNLTLSINACDNLVYTFYSMLVNLPSSSFSTQGTSAISFTSTTQMYFTIPQSGLLNSLKVNKAATIQAALIFIINATNKIGFSLTNLTLYRVESALIPEMTPL